MMIREGTIVPLVTLIAFTVVFWIAMRRLREGEGKEIPIRRLPAFDALDEAVKRSTEMGKPVHITPGYNTTGGFDAQIFAALEVLRHVAVECAQFDTPIIVTNSSALVYPVTEDIVRSVYKQVGKPEAYKTEYVRYLSTQQLAYAAGVVGILEREEPAASILIGPFYAESLIFAEAGFVAGALQVAGTAMTAQIPFFVAACDYVLIGEDIYTAGAYISKDIAKVGCLVAQEVGKYAAIILIVVGSILQSVGSDWLKVVFEK